MVNPPKGGAGPANITDNERFEAVSYSLGNGGDLLWLVRDGLTGVNVAAGIRAKVLADELANRLNAIDSMVVIVESLLSRIQGGAGRLVDGLGGCDGDDTGPANGTRRDTVH